MNETAFILQNRLQEITVRLERADLLHCDASWGSGGSIPPYDSIGLILDGEGSMCVNGIKIHPAKGQLYLLPAKSNQSFSTVPQHPYQKYYCHFEISCHGTGLFELIKTPFCVDAKDPNTAERIFQEMIPALKCQDPASSIKANRCMMDLLVYFLESCPAGSISLVENNMDSPLSRAIAFAENNLDQAVTVQKMAEIAGYHPSHFARLFQKRLGVSPVQFIIQKKTAKAIEQLTATSLPISVIAESLGFGSQFYFCSFFKKHTGMSPSEYRNAFLHTRR